ncbi:MAG: DUF5685 family protein [Eubacterium sp.]|nr:DUF5685 family protein [Eubacterium sp.]
MFGYVTTNKPELKLREFDRYKGFYCGLCRSLRSDHGFLGQMTLTYDMTFLVLLLSSLYEPKTQERKARCIVHPAKKQHIIQNQATKYGADLNILLTQKHFEDDWQDEKKIQALAGAKAFGKRARQVEKNYPRQADAIRKSLDDLARCERENCQNLDKVARPFGQLMGELFVWKEDAFQEILRSFGFYLGKFIYLMDAYMDRQEDEKKGCFNPLMDLAREEDYEERIREILDHTMRMAIVEFEKLPLEQDLPILRNILYEGVWSAYERKKRDE